VLASY